MIMVTRFLAKGLGPEEFGAYSLSRRVVSTIIPFSTLMMGVAVTRYIALSKDDGSKYNYFLSGFILGILPSVVFAIVGLIYRHELSQLIYHSTAHTSLFMATLLILVGYPFYNILFAFYRGDGKMIYANLWQIGLIALGPIAIAWWFSKSGQADLIIFLMGGLLFLAVVPIALLISRAILNSKIKGHKIRRNLKELFQFGFPRSPGGIAFSGILTIGPFLAPYFGSLKDAGFLVVGQSMLRVVEGGVVAFGLVALPKLAQAFGERRNEFLKESTTDIITFVFHLGLFTTFHLILWSDQIVLIWLGPQYMDAISLMKVLLLAVVPFFAFVMLRQIVNAIEEKPLNTVNCVCSFVIALISSFVLAFLGLGVMGLAIGSTIGLSVLGLLTVRYLWKLYQLKIRILRIQDVLLLNIFFIIYRNYF